MAVLLALGLALVVGIAFGARWVISRPRIPIFVSVNGVAVQNPESSLRTADDEFSALVRAAHGNAGKSSGCYFEHSTSAPYPTDIYEAVLCGPVQFYGGNPSRPYLAYSATAGTGVDHQVDLAISKVPVQPDPIAVPLGVTLIGPHGATHTRTDPTLRASTSAPEGSAGVVAVETVSPDKLATADFHSAMGSNAIAIRLDEFGPVTGYGSGMNARSAPAGTHLIAFRLSFDPGENEFAPLSSVTLSVHADGRAMRVPLNADTPQTGQLFVVSVESADQPVDLTLVDQGITQTVSLRTGQPGAGNIVALPALFPNQLINASGSALARVTSNETFLAHLKIEIGYGTLHFFTPVGHSHPKSNADVFLFLGACYTSADFVDSTTCFSFRDTDITVTPQGANAPIAPVDVDNEQAFEVPADFTSGTLTIAGSESSTDGLSMSIVQPTSIPFTLAAERN